MGAGASTGSGGPAANGGAGPPPPRRSGKSSSIGAKLALAAKEGDKETVETLLGMAGSDPNAMDPTTGNTALHFAAAMGHEDMVTTLLMYNSLELSIENFHHTTALILAAGNGHVKIIDALLADPRCDPNFMTSGGVGALHMAAQRGRLLSVRSLLRHPATDPNRPNPAVQGGDTPLHIAARSGKSKVVRALLADDRINISVLNAAGTSPAAAAKDAGQEEMVQLILQRAPSGYEGMSSADAGPYDPFRGAKFRGTEIKYPEQAPAPPEGGFRLPAPSNEREYESYASAGGSKLENQAPAHSASFRQHSRAEPAHDEGWQSVPGLNFHQSSGGGGAPTASGRWQGGESERRDSMSQRSHSSHSDSASASVRSATAPQPEKKGFFGRMRDKLEETNEAAAARAKEKAEAAEKKRLQAEEAKRDMMERKLAEAAAKRLRDAEEQARKEAVLRSKKEKEDLKKMEAERKKQEEAERKKREAEEKKKAEEQKKADANRKAWEARQRKEYEERAKKNAQARQERNGTGQQSQPKAASSFFSSKPSVSATKKLWVNHESAWEAFDAAAPPVITYAKVPWPPDSEDVLRGMVSASTEQGHKDDVAKKVYRKATLRWHPDKFIGKFGKLMAPADEERIMNEVKNISQAINRAWQIANY